MKQEEIPHMRQPEKVMMPFAELLESAVAIRIQRERKKTHVDSYGSFGNPDRALTTAAVTSVGITLKSAKFPTVLAESQ